MNTESKSPSISKRVDWIDCAKGIAILLTIIGHSVSYGIYGSTLRGLVFSFHMPLFFILSCTTYKCSTNALEFKKKSINGMKHLLRPAIITYIIIIMYQCITDHSLLFSLGFWKGKLYTLLFSSGVNTTFNDFEVVAIGIPWFFFALFIGRTIFDLLHQKFEDKVTLFMMCCIVGMIGIIFGKLQWLPFSMDIALAIMPFFYFGNSLKGKDLNAHPVRDMIIYGLIWICTLYITFPDYNNWSYLELATRRYPLFPLCYITAVAGTMFIGMFSRILCKLRKLALPLLYIGKNSMYLLCVHILDGIWYSLWNIDGHQFYTALKRTVVDLIIFIVFMLLRAGFDKLMTHRKNS